ncbi:winged helix-turn-helix transcriptional regulator [Herbidospora mongoliensis]|uniref:winged helix-turn-helix transcriptional regulator n=1 Tax=Herbidospora mongoliensis TaxID=688067 RepID=UPI00082A1D9C|nr:helix-turn-helix domain-containing protein [Herbidospora mongoliensis]
MYPLLPVNRAACGAAPVLRAVGDKWSLLVMGVLAERPFGFNELDRAVDGLSRRMLTRVLAALVREGLVDRAAPSGPGGRAEYRLSEAGHDLLPLVIAVGEWAEAHARRRGQGVPPMPGKAVDQKSSPL